MNKKDIFFHNGSINFLSSSDCDLGNFLSWVNSTLLFPRPNYRTAVLAELKRRVEVLS